MEVTRQDPSSSQSRDLVTGKLRNACCRILRPGTNEFLCTGWIFHKEQSFALIGTVAHGLIDQAGDIRSLPEERWEVLFDSNQRFDAQLVHWVYSPSNHLDFAILKVSHSVERLPAPIKPELIDVKNERPVTNLLQEKSLGISGFSSPQGGAQVSYDMKVASTPTFPGAPEFHVIQLDGMSGQAGMSGAPIVDLNSGAAIAVQVSHLDDDPRAIFALPLTLPLRMFPLPSREQSDASMSELEEACLDKLTLSKSLLEDCAFISEIGHTLFVVYSECAVFLRQKDKWRKSNYLQIAVTIREKLDRLSSLLEKQRGGHIASEEWHEVLEQLLLHTTSKSVATSKVKVAVTQLAHLRELGDYLRPDEALPLFPDKEDGAQIKISKEDAIKLLLDYSEKVLGSGNIILSVLAFNEDYSRRFAEHFDKHEFREKTLETIIDCAGSGKDLRAELLGEPFLSCDYQE